MGDSRSGCERTAVQRQRIDSSCPECGSHEIERYRVLSDGGWWVVTKCQKCLFSIRREREPNLHIKSTTLWELIRRKEQQR